MKAKRIFIIPWGDSNIASSRLRVWNVLPHLDAKIGTPDTYKKGDVLIIQKALRHDELEKAQREGAKVIYDIDDNYMDKADFVQMSEDADMTTVGSSFFHRYYPEAPVIDDSLDWDGTMKEGTEICRDHDCFDNAPFKKEPSNISAHYHPSSKSNLVGWHGYGNYSYINAIAPVFEQKGIRVRTIVGKEYINHYGRYDALEWNLATIDKNLAECDFGVIYLPEDDFSQSKGMNKLIKGWAIGLPMFFSYSPEYDRVISESGIKGFMTRNWDTQDYTKPWVPEMREYAMKFTPKKIAKQWMDAIKLL